MLYVGKIVFFLCLALTAHFAFISPAAAQVSAFTINEPDSQAFHGSFHGFGAEWDPFFWNSYNQSQGLTQADWDLITTRMQEMDIKLVRMWMQLYFARNYNGDYSQWDFENVRMKSLYKHLDFACKNNITVALTEWAWSFWPSFKMFNGNPADYGYAQAIAYYLKELIDNRGYSCIQYLIVGNEPDYEIVNKLPFSQYETMINNVDKALKENGLRSKLQLIGPDAACCQSLFMDTLQSSLHKTFDIYDFHHYTGEANVINGTSRTEFQTRRDWIGQFSPDPLDNNKPLFITEAGMNDLPKDSFAYAINMADYGTQALTSQIQAVIAWNMYDIYYDQGHTETEDNTMIPWGMWMYKDQNWALRPWAQTWGLLVKFAPRGSTQAAVNNAPPGNLPYGAIRVGAVKRSDGGWSIFLVNRDATATTVQLTLPQATPSYTFTKYLVDTNTFSANPDKIIPPATGSVTTASTLSMSLPAESFTVLAQLGSMPTPTLASPTATGSPTGCPMKSQGDANCDGRITLSDYEHWRREYLKEAATTLADFNGSQSVTLSDYEVWRSHIF